MNWLLLGAAIGAEVCATTALKLSCGFTRAAPSIVTVLGYGVAFYCLSLALRSIPTGIAYAVWSGIGIVLVAAIAWIWQGQRLDTPSLAGMALIIAGVLVMNLWPRSPAG